MPEAYPEAMKVLKTNRELAAWREEAQGGHMSAGLVFVPTMGALHAGHRALLAAGAALARQRGGAGCVVSVFVNPTQFNDPADLARYPRTLDADLAMCREAGAAAVYVPGVEDIYPSEDASAAPAPRTLPRVATEPGLEDRQRPGHFAGVYRVVKRLFELVRPEAAIFGAKDWQQLQVIRALAEELADGGLRVEIRAHETVREPDGLAMSSRNRFLSAEDRRRGVALSRALAAARGMSVERGEAQMREVLDEAGIAAEYAVIRDAETLEGVRAGRARRALIAAPVGSVRLIDNAEV